MDSLTYDFNQSIDHCILDPGRKTWAYNRTVKSLNTGAGYKHLSSRRPNLSNLVCYNLCAAESAFLRAWRPDLGIQHLLHAGYFAHHCLRYINSQSGLAYSFCVGDLEFELPALRLSGLDRPSDSSDVMEPMLWLSVLLDDSDMLEAIQHRFCHNLVAQQVKERPGDCPWLCQVLTTLGYAVNELSLEQLSERELQRIQEQDVTKPMQLYLDKVRRPITNLYTALAHGVDQSKFERIVYEALIGYNQYWIDIKKTRNYDDSGYYLEGRGGVSIALCSAVRLAHRKYGYKLSFSHPSIPSAVCYDEWPRLNLSKFSELPPHPDDGPNPFE